VESLRRAGLAAALRTAGRCGLWLWAAAIAGLWAAAPATRAQATRHVILVSIDGFAAYHLADASIDLPNIRALAAAGAAAEASETVFPSVTHPSHTTLITGVTPRRHGVVDNTVTDRRTGKRFHLTNLPRRESVRVPTLFDAVRRSGRRSAAFFWPETKDDPAIDANVAEVFRPDGGADPAAVTPGLLAELRQAGVPIDAYYAFYDDPFGQGGGDLALTQAAIHVFKRDRPALTALHLLVTDKVQHEYGPAHYLSRAALTSADYCVGLLRRAVADAGLADQTTFVIAADHGFITVSDEINVAPLIASPELDGRVRWSADKWYLFAERTAQFDPGRDAAALDRILARLAGTPGMARVVRPEDLAGLGFPDYDDNPYARGHVIVAAAADLHVVIDPGSASVERRRKREPYHGHGYLPDHASMRPALVLSGAGVAIGRNLGRVRNLDVAPTIARLLGLSLPDVDGRVLREALK
jgi:predicted AlkP superfamily pyrophosphatase or phosphodiesterase